MFETEIEELLARIQKLKLVSTYKLTYNNSSPDIVPDTVFSIALYADKNMEVAPLFVMSDPEGYHAHLITNQSENIVRIIIGLEKGYINDIKDTENAAAYVEFMASMIEELMTHCAILPAKSQLDPIEGLLMMIGPAMEAVNLAKEKKENAEKAKRLCELLTESLFVEYSRHPSLPCESVTFVDYSTGVRDEYRYSFNPPYFTKIFGIQL